MEATKKSKSGIVPITIWAKIWTVMFLLTEIAFIVFMSITNIFPLKYFIFLIAMMVIATVLILPLLCSQKEKAGRRRTGMVLATIISVFLIMGSYYLYSTNNLFGTISKDDKQTEDFHVMVLKEGSYKEVEEIKDKDIFVSEGGTASFIDAKIELKDEYKVNYKTAGNYMELGHQLVDEDGKTHDNIIFVSSVNYDMLCEEITDFKENTKILHTISIEMESKDIAKHINVTEEPFNMYISGIDTYGNINKVSRSDVNMIMTVDPINKKILLTSIPRDMYVTLHSYGEKDKLTHSGIYGAEETVATVEDWLGIDINYYLRVNFTTLEDVVDVIGGIDVQSDFSFTSHVSDYSYVKGINHMNGEKALFFARERYAFASGDRQRIKNQQLVIQGIINKILGDKSLLLKYPQLLGAVRDQMRTNMLDDDIAALVKMQLNDMSGWEIETSSITGTGTSAMTYSGGNRKLYVMVPNDNSVLEAVEKIKKITDQPQPEQSEN